LFVISFCFFGYRFACFGSKCSLTDTDVHLVHVTTDEDEAQGRGVVEPHCPVPFVKLNTDILETESLNLLAEATFVDTLLTALPVGFLYQVLGVVKYCSQFLIFLWCVLQVLSEEEQHALSATPAHPAGLHGGMFSNIFI